MTEVSKRMSPEAFEAEYVCSYRVGGMMDVSTHCGRPAVRLVVWRPEVTDVKTMTYCRTHFRSVEGLLDMATEVTDLVPDEC